MLESAHQILSHYGYPGLFLFLLLGIVGLPLPDETLITTAGFFVSEGRLALLPTLLVGVGGSMCGIALSYVIGRTMGYRLLHRAGPWLHLTEDKLARFHRWYERTGRWTLTFGYFVPGLRHVVAIAAGANGLSWHSFALFAYSGALLWVSTFLALGYVLGREWERAGPRVRVGIVILCAAAAVAAATIVLIRRAQQRSRQRQQPR